MDAVSGGVKVEEIAERAGISARSLRRLIADGLISRPTRDPVGGTVAYSRSAARRIELFLLRRLAAGHSRGPLARQRKQRAELMLTGQTPADGQAA